ncbi:L-seryl-tRNA selenium transferase [Campylobacter sp.]|uniref:L-seryl-tRNA selenium transferase n=1 Tax=Campylobacter sp. TaxID=205 RepID=UPI0026F5DD61|nr:L-seryl-tRNA selenium transferase [Campylobacter sp.]
MRKFHTILSIFFIAVLFSGCGTKRQYFEPEKVTSKVDFEYKLPDNIASTSLNGAVLENGMVITKDGLLPENIKFPKNTLLLNFHKDKFITSTLDGNLAITDKTGGIVYEKKFNEAIVSASLEDNRLATLSSSNTIRLINITTDSILLEFESSNVYAQDSRVAAPYFLSSLVIFPTLDGKIMIVDKSNGRILRDVVVSSEEFFNNIIFLDVINDTMIASTGKRIVSISPEKTLYYNGEIKNVISNKDKIYIFEKDGKVILADLNLQKLNSINFKFAIFSNAVTFNDHLYIIEKKGYLIKTRLDLSDPQIFELNDEIKDKSFVGFKDFYYDNHYLKLN